MAQTLRLPLTQTPLSSSARSKRPPRPSSSRSRRNPYVLAEASEHVLVLAKNALPIGAAAATFGAPRARSASHPAYSSWWWSRASAGARRVGLMRLLFQPRTRGVRSRRFFVPLDEFVAPPLSSVRQLEIGGRVSLGGDPPFDGPDRRRVAPGELVFRVELFGPVERHLWRALSRMLRANRPWFGILREGQTGTISSGPPAPRLSRQCRRKVACET